MVRDKARGTPESHCSYLPFGFFGILGFLGQAFGANNLRRLYASLVSRRFLRVAPVWSVGGLFNIIPVCGLIEECEDFLEQGVRC